MQTNQILLLSCLEKYSLILLDLGLLAGHFVLYFSDGLTRFWPGHDFHSKSLFLLPFVLEIRATRFEQQVPPGLWLFVPHFEYTNICVSPPLSASAVFPGFCHFVKQSQPLKLRALCVLRLEFHHFCRYITTLKQFLL